jgi:cellobiose-specific phosphotransferase system component IIC
MWLRNGGLLSAVMAVLAAGAVVTATWFALAHESDWRALFDRLNDSTVGIITLVTALLAGWLLAVAFDRGEESIVLLCERSADEEAAE